MSGAMGQYKYTSDNTVDYRVKVDASNAGQVGGVVATSENWYPRGWQMRYLLCESAAGVRRKIWCLDPTNAAWVGGDNTMALQEAGVAGTVDYTVTGRFGEKRTSRG